MAIRHSSIICQYLQASMPSHTANRIAVGNVCLQCRRNAAQTAHRVLPRRYFVSSSCLENGNERPASFPHSHADDGNYMIRRRASHQTLDSEGDSHRNNRDFRQSDSANRDSISDSRSLGRNSQATREQSMLLRYQESSFHGAGASRRQETGGFGMNRQSRQATGSFTEPIRYTRNQYNRNRYDRNQDGRNQSGQFFDRPLGRTISRRGENGTSRADDALPGLSESSAGRFEGYSRSDALAELRRDDTKRRGSLRDRVASAVGRGRREEHARRRDRSDEDRPTRRRPLNPRRDEDEDDEDEGGGREYQTSKEEWKRRKEERKAARQLERQVKEAANAKRHLQLHLPPYISIANLAKILGIRFEQFSQQLAGLGFSDISHDHVLSFEDASLIVMENGFEPIVDEAAKQNLVAAPWPTDSSSLPTRPPVVTIMGHVDHGKTTILDFLRKSSIAAGEHGGITQHIGAFSVPMTGGKNITFLDTPGHAAFLAMRERGANVTDIVVLVVAADDSVMPQTIEAIKHAKAAKVPMIVAINKADKPDANVERVKQDVSKHDIELEEFGGDIQAVAISGKTGLGMHELEDAIITLSDILDHRAPPDGPVEGWIIESLTKSHGKVATILIRRGTVAPGTILVAGTAFCRVRRLRNEFGETIQSATPGTAVEIDGWRELPNPGDEALQAEDEQHAASVIRIRESLAQGVKLARDMDAINVSRKAAREGYLVRHEAKLAATTKADRKRVLYGGTDRVVEGSFHDTAKSTGIEELLLVVKGDVGGSVEAIQEIVGGLGNHKARARIIRSGVGPVNEGDVTLAEAANAVIIAFNVSTEDGVMGQARAADVEISEHTIIYRVSENITSRLEALLPEIVSVRVTGEAEIAQKFSITLAGKTKMWVAGCKVRNGLVKKGSKVRVIRRGETVYEGTLTSLRNEKKVVLEMKKDTECGMGFDEWEDFEPGDKVQCIIEERKAGTFS